MKTLLSKLIFAGVVILPTALIVVMSYAGVGNPLNGRTVETLSILDQSESDIEIVYFGFAGCSFICPRSLFTMGEALDSLNTEKDQKVEGLFVDVNASQQMGNAEKYSSFFSTYINGLNVTEEKLGEIKAEFGVQVNKTGKGELDIDHTDRFYVLKQIENKWTIERIVDGSAKAETLIASVRSITE